MLLVSALAHDVFVDNYFAMFYWSIALFMSDLFRPLLALLTFCGAHRDLYKSH